MAVTVESILKMSREDIQNNRKISDKDLNSFLHSLSGNPEVLVRVLTHIWGEQPTPEDIVAATRPDVRGLKKYPAVPVNPTFVLAETASSGY